MFANSCSCISDPIRDSRSKPYYQDCLQEKIASTNSLVNQAKVRDSEIGYDYDSPAFRLSCSFCLPNDDSRTYSMPRTGGASGDRRFDGRERSWRYERRATCGFIVCRRGRHRAVSAATTLLQRVCLRELFGTFFCYYFSSSLAVSRESRQKMQVSLECSSFISNCIGAQVGPETRKC